MLSDDIRVTHSFPAADLGGAAILLNVGERIGILPLLTDGAAPITAPAAAERLGLPEQPVADYLEALAYAGLVERGADGFRALPVFPQLLEAIGYVSWTLNANRPFHEHAPDFFRSPADARRKHPRDGHQVAVTSQWMGAGDFYPAARRAIFDLAPRRFVDLGAGSARLLIETLLRFPQASGVALDLSAPACAAARHAAERAGVADRLTVLEQSIQSVADQEAVIAGADVIHAGFVFHDMLPGEEATFDRVLAACARAVARTGGKLMITDAAPYVDNPRERMFAAAVTYIHLFFQGRRLLSEAEWSAKLLANGFLAVQCTRLPFPSGRLYAASATP